MTLMPFIQNHLGRLVPPRAPFLAPFSPSCGIGIATRSVGSNAPSIRGRGAPTRPTRGSEHLLDRLLSVSPQDRTRLKVSEKWALSLSHCATLSVPVSSLDFQHVDGSGFGVIRASPPSACCPTGGDEADLAFRRWGSVLSSASTARMMLRRLDLSKGGWRAGARRAGSYCPGAHSSALALELGGVLRNEAANLAALLEDRLPLVRVERDREAADPVRRRRPHQVAEPF